MPESPTPDEIQFLIQQHWQKHPDPSQARANDSKFLYQKTQATIALMRQLIRDGLQPLDAEVRAIREVAHEE